MTIKSFTKLSLSALLLAAATHSAIAEEATGGEVTLNGGKGTTISWSEFVNALNDPSTIPADETTQAVKDAKNALDNATNAYIQANQAAIQAAQDTKTAENTYNTSLADYNSLSQQLSTQSALYNKAVSDLSLEKDKTATPKWLTNASNNANNFKSSYENGLTNSEPGIWYKTIKIGRITWLDVSFSNPGDGWTGLNEDDYDSQIVNGNDVTFTKVRIYVGPESTAPEHYIEVANYQGNRSYILDMCTYQLKSVIDSKEYRDNQAKIDKLQQTIDTTGPEVTRLTNLVKDYTDPKENGKSKLDNQLADYTTAKTAQGKAEETADTAKQTMDDAQAVYDNALQASKDSVEATYKNVTLTANVTADTPIANFDGTIEGNGHVITLSGIENLFTRLTGASLMNVAVNGNIFNAQSNAAFNCVAAWRDSNGIYYDENGTITSNIGTIGELGFFARKKFGADFTNGQLAALTDDTKVYNITVYNVDNTVPAYVHKDNNGFYNATSDYRNAINTFIKSETNDFGDLPNVFVTDKAGNSTCENVVITDGNDFYCPFDIKATKMSYTRKFKVKENTVCLPFELKETANPNIMTLCRYERETADKFYFKKIAGSIPANTPFLLYAENPFTFETFGETTIKQTPAERIVMDEGAEDDPSKCFGTLKRTNIDEFVGNYQAHKIYLLKDGKFKPAAEGENITSAPFRIALSSEIAAVNGQRAPRLIGILDEKGIEITDDIITGVENVAEETSSLNIAGGQGEIVITSDADYGKVEVYTMAGGVAAVADVMAGTTSVSLQKGIYIVMGKKVMVK